MHPKYPPIFPYSWASDWGEDQYGLFMGLDYQGVRVVFRWVEPGTFMMGSPDDEKGRFSSREDYHQVTLSQGFWVAETTVTQALWQAVMNANPSSFKGEELPVERVSWDDCQAFIEKLNTYHPDFVVRLPWEAEWEYACRACTKTAFNFGDDLSLVSANYRGAWEIALGEDKEKWAEEAKVQWGEQALQKTADVKSYFCNDWGLYEMHGNVWEWCQDYWQDSLGKEPAIDPQNEQEDPEEGAERVMRGGSWYVSGKFVRSAYRFSRSPVSRSNDLGLRLSLGQPSSRSRDGAA